MRNTTHTKVKKAALGSWKVDPDQDRKASEVKEYTLAPEELAKYKGVGKPYKKASLFPFGKKKAKEG